MKYQHDSRNWDELSIASGDDESLPSPAPLPKPCESAAALGSSLFPKPSAVDDQRRRNTSQSAANERPRRYSASEGVTGFQSFEPKLKLSLEIQERRGFLTERLTSASPTETSRFALPPLFWLSSHSRGHMAGLHSDRRSAVSVATAAAAPQTSTVTSDKTNDDEFLYFSDQSLDDECTAEDPETLSSTSSKENHFSARIAGNRTVQAKRRAGRVGLSRLTVEDDLSRAESFLRRQLVSRRRAPDQTHRQLLPGNTVTAGIRRASAVSPATVPSAFWRYRKEWRRQSRWRAARPERLRRLTRSGSDGQLLHLAAPKADNRQLLVMQLRAAAVPITPNLSPNLEPAKQRPKQPRRLFNMLWTTTSAPTVARKRKKSLQGPGGEMPPSNNAGSPRQSLLVSQEVAASDLSTAAAAAAATTTTDTFYCAPADAKGCATGSTGGSSEEIRRIETLVPQDDYCTAAAPVLSAAKDAGVEHTPADVLLLTSEWQRHDLSLRLSTLAERPDEASLSPQAAPTARSTNAATPRPTPLPLAAPTTLPECAVSAAQNAVAPVTPVCAAASSPADTMDVPLSPIDTPPPTHATASGRPPLLSGVGALLGLGARPGTTGGDQLQHHTPESAAPLTARRNWTTFEHFSDDTTPALSDLDSLTAVSDDDTAVVMTPVVPPKGGFKSHSDSRPETTRTPAPIEQPAPIASAVSQKASWQLHWPFKRKNGKGPEKPDRSVQTRRASLTAASAAAATDPV